MNEAKSTLQPLKAVEATSPWADFRVERDMQGSLVDKVVNGITALIEEGRLRAGAKMPSIRQFAKRHAISTFTVVESYERLSALGLLSSRRGSGYFVARNDVAPSRPIAPTPPLTTMRPLAPDLYSGSSDLLPVGASWLPPEWHGEGMMLDAVRQATRIPFDRLRGYGHPMGFPALRQHLADTLSADLFSVSPDQTLLTNGAIHACDMILTALTKPGDVVFVEDPGYSNLPDVIRQHNCTPIGIARDEAGLDLTMLQKRAEKYRPKLMFVSTVFQNPLGTCLSPAQAYALLKTAGEFDFRLVEGDSYRDLATRAEPSLAALDGLQRVIRVGSFSKTLSPSVRVGSISAHVSLISDLVRAKMLSGLTTSEINERAVYHAITTSSYRRMLERLKGQLSAACASTLATLTDVGMVPLARPRGGMFVSAGWGQLPTPDINSKTVADLALRHGILLAPDSFFSMAPPGSIWFRFNVAYADSPRLVEFLRHTGRELRELSPGLPRIS